MIIETLSAVLIKNSILTAFVVVGLVMWVSYFLSNKLTQGKFHGSAIAITLGLLLAYVGGLTHEGTRGLANIEIFSGLAILGGAMFRDFAIVATAFGANLKDLKSSGLAGVISLF
ncbi:MAG: malonate transporter subunit MadM, partial [Emcibacteraceae bacterium]|nr:malonate transporter subunit MadM [Emcibacteraceae bacterium]